MVGLPGRLFLWAGPGDACAGWPGTQLPPPSASFVLEKNFFVHFKLPLKFKELQNKNHKVKKLP
jgi:hypothetical protein